MILSVSLIILICIISFIRLGHKNIWQDFYFNCDIVFICAYLLWIVLESSVSKKEMQKGNKTHDFGSCEIYAMGQALTFLSALWFDSVWTRPNLLHLLGFTLFLVAASYRLWAIRTLGRYYSHIVREVEGHQIITAGPYRHIRHPAYAGMIFAHIGIVIYFFNAITLLLFLLIFLPAILFRIRIEEKMLFTMDGYSEFAKNRSRILPFLW